MNLPLNNAERFNFDGEFQFRLLALMLQDVHTLARLKHIVRPAYFVDTTASLICSWTYDYFDRYNTIPTSVVYNQMITYHVQTKPELAAHEDVYKQWVTALLSTIVYERDYILEQVQRFCRKQELKLATLEAMVRFQRDQDFENVGDLFDQARSRLAQTHGSIGLDPLNIPDDQLFSALFARDVRDPIPTNWSRINSLVGGPGKKELFVLAAPPNAGKSWSLANIGAAGVQQGRFVVHISLEMSKELTTHRYYALLTGVSLNELAANPGAIAAANGRLRQAGGRFVVQEFPAQTVRVSDIRDYLIFVEASVGRAPDMVIVDYADLCMPRGRNSRSEDETVHRHALAGVYVDLRAIAVSRNLAMVTVSQTNRSSVGKETITISDLAECFEKAAHADIIIGICQNDEEVQMNRMRFYIAKNRTQRKGDEVGLSIDFARGTMVESQGADMSFINNLNAQAAAGQVPQAGALPPPPAWYFQSHNNNPPAPAA